MGEIVAVDDVSLEIEDGEFVTVVGPSGCGKTTTLRMLAGLEKSTDGTIHFGDRDVTDLPAKKRDIAMVFQNYALYPHKTVFQNMEFGLRMSTDLGKDERRRRVEEAAAMMGIEDLLDDKPDELSGGQKQRVALGRSIVREPEVFLFDEPLSNLDAKLRTTMRTEIQELQKELGVTSVYVTHDQEEAMTMGDRIVILNDGKLQQEGRPTEVYENPANEFVGGFVGSPSMNFLDVEASASEVGLRLTTENGRFDYVISDLPSERTRQLDGNRYRLGIRPEKITVTESAGSQSFRAIVNVIEPIGSDNYLHLDIGQDFIARVASDVRPALDDEVTVTFPQEEIHLFDPESGEKVFGEKKHAVPA